MTAREDANKDVIRRFVEEWLQSRDAAALQRLCHEDMSFDWGILGAGQGIEALRRSEDGARAAFPDLDVRTRLLVAEGDLVVNVSDVSGTHRGAWLGVPPTGRALSWTAVEIYRLSEGKISHQWLVEDWARVLVHLGAVRIPDPFDASADRTSMRPSSPP